MMDDRHPFASPVVPDPPSEQPGVDAKPTTDVAAAPATDTSVSEPTLDLPSAATMKFKSCRWRCDPEAGEYCTHRDVLPFAGKEGFVPESWCPDCAFYKLRRTPKKRDYNAY